LFDSASAKFQETGSMTTARYAHSAVALLDSRVALLGGYGKTNGQALQSVEIYDPQTGTFTAHGNLVEARANATATPRCRMAVSWSSEARTLTPMAISPARGRVLRFMIRPLVYPR
jgi:hypothetical protein